MEAQQLGCQVIHKDCTNFETCHCLRRLRRAEDKQTNPEPSVEVRYLVIAVAVVDFISG